MPFVMTSPASCQCLHAMGWLLLSGLCLAGCGGPVRIGFEEARGLRPPTFAGDHPTQATDQTPATPAASAAASGGSAVQARPSTHDAAPAARPVEPAAESTGKTVTAPQLSRAAGGNELISLRIAAGGAATFAVPLPPHRLPAGTAIAVRSNGQLVPAQLDTISTHPDGSVALALVTLRRGVTGDVTLVRAAP